MDQDLKNLIELDLLELFDMKDAPEAEQTAFLQRCMDGIFEAVVTRIKEDLPEDKKQEFAETFKEGVPEEQRIAFLQEHVSHINELIINAILAFKKSSQNAVASLPEE